MISKVFNGHSFYHACRYIVNKPGAQVLATEGVRGHDYRLMAQDFLQQQALRPAKEQACFHSILSFYPGEKPADEKIKEIAEEYLEKLGIQHTQFAITKHTDRKHLHVHMVANMVNNEGKAISDSYIGLKGKRIAQELTQKHELIPAQTKRLELTNMEALSQSEVNKYKIYKAIHENLPHCKTLNDLEKRLSQRGIETQYKYKGQSQELQGISFKIGEDCFKGSKIDRQYSLSRLQHSLSLQQAQLQEMPEQHRRHRQANGLHR